MSTNKELAQINADYKEKFGFVDQQQSFYRALPGVNKKLIEELSARKNEPRWMLEFRLKALEHFLQRPMPTWGPDLTAIDFSEVSSYVQAIEEPARKWEEVPEEMKETFNRLGISEEEQKMLGGVSLQYDSESVFHQTQQALSEQGVIFLDTDTALREYPELFKKWFSTVIPANDNKFAALNSAFWSGGSFVYVPPGVEITQPLQTYFRINSQAMLQAERTLIIADEGAKVSYMEGCSAPSYSADDSLHAAVVEIVALPGAEVNYFTAQNWDPGSVYNMVTKRAVAQEQATVRWIQAELGCLSANTKVHTTNGLVSISDVKEGDKVYSLNPVTCEPHLNKVVAQKNMGKKPVFKLQTDDYREIEATANHPFLSLRKDKVQNNYSLKWRALEELYPGEMIAVDSGLPDDGQSRKLDDFIVQDDKRTQNKINLPLESTEELMWFLGIYLGDGCIEYTKAGVPIRVNIAIPPFDKSRNRLEKNIYELFQTKWRKRGPYSLGIGSKRLGQFLLWLGMGGKAHTKKIPSWIFSLPVRQKLAFIEGYLDSDGHERGRKIKNNVQYGQIVFSSVNKTLLKDLKALMNGLGIKSGKIAQHSSLRKLPLGKIEKRCSCYYLSCNIRNNLDIIREKRRIEPEIKFIKIRSIEPSGVKETYDLEIESSHNFLAESIYVHNSRINMKYPSIYLMGRKAHGEILSVAMAGENQDQDTGGKVFHVAPDTSSTITSKSISSAGGIASYRGLLEVAPGAENCISRVACDALLLDEKSISNTWPTIRIGEPTADIGHEATVSKVGDEQIHYLQAHGLTREAAEALIVNGFVEPIIKEMPLEYAVEMNRLIELQMEGSIG